jgi:RecA/RadA recombinase
MAQKKSDKTKAPLTEEELDKEIEELENEVSTEVDEGSTGKKSKVDKKLITRLRDIRKKSMDILNLGFKFSSCIPLDLGLTDGKGIPIGVPIMFWAEPGTGKTTIVADMLYRILAKQQSLPDKEKERVLYVDLEHSANLLCSMGLQKFIDDGTLILCCADINFNDLEGLFTAAIEGVEGFENIKYIVVDSITSVQSQELEDKSVSAGDFGSNAKARSRFYPKYLPKLLEKKITSFWISQVRHNKDAMGPYDSKVKAAVSELDLHYMEIIGKLTKRETGNGELAKKKVKTSDGNEIEVPMMLMLTLKTYGNPCKNRFGRIPEIKMLVEPGKRVINAYNLRLLILTNKLATEVGGKIKKAYISTQELADIIENPEIANKELSAKEFNKLLQKNATKLENKLSEQGLFKHTITVKGVDEEGER